MISMPQCWRLRLRRSSGDASSLVRDVYKRQVILRGEGRAFCAGADLSSVAFAPPGAGRAQRQMAMQRLYSGLPKLMRAAPQPIIALVQGAACGAGFSLALAADVRIAGPAGKMNAAYLRVGVGGCDMGSGYMLPRLVGLSLASELLLTCLLYTSTNAFGEIKRLFAHVSSRSAASQMEEEAMALARVARTEDAWEGMTSFLQKRPAKFTGN